MFIQSSASINRCVYNFSHATYIHTAREIENIKTVFEERSELPNVSIKTLLITNNFIDKLDFVYRKCGRINT